MWKAWQARAALATAQTPGWRLMPVEPTEEILSALFRNERDAKRAWKEAIAAAPAKPEGVMSDIHELKADPTPFEDVYSGRKMAEVRLDDRGYKGWRRAPARAPAVRPGWRRSTPDASFAGASPTFSTAMVAEGVVVLSLGNRPSPDQSRRADPIRGVQLPLI